MLNVCEVFPIRKNLIRNIVQTPKVILGHPKNAIKRISEESCLLTHHQYVDINVRLKRSVFQICIDYWSLWKDTSFWRRLKCNYLIFVSVHMLPMMYVHWTCILYRKCSLDFVYSCKRFVLESAAVRNIALD